MSKCEGVVKMRGEVEQDQGFNGSSSPLASYVSNTSSRCPWFSALSITLVHVPI